MRFVPHEYQRYCTEYIKTHPIAALFLDMGLGKTVITLSAIKDLMLETFEVSKVLIIAPLRVARDTWPAEIEKWDHLKELDISVIVGDVKTRIAAVHHPAMIYIVNRENIRWLVEYYEKNGTRWDFMDTVEEAGDVMHLSQNVVETFIDRIEVFNDERVKIHFTFENVLADYAE